MTQQTTQPSIFEILADENAVIGLVVVDAEYGFADDGSLPIQGAYATVPQMLALARHPRIKVKVGTRDAHPADHFSFDEEPRFEDGSWPVHCVDGTRGAEIMDELKPLLERVFDKGRERDVEQYSGFDPGELQKYLREQGVTHVIIVGWAEDVCVDATDAGALTNGFQQRIVVTDATAPVTPEGGQAAEQRMRERGTYLATTEEVLAALSGETR